MLLEVPHLEELPDHHHLQHGADAAGGHDEGVRGEHELVQAREERAVLERLRDEGIDVLLEGQLDADADRPRPLGGGRRPLRWRPASGPARRR